MNRFKYLISPYFVFLCIFISTATTFPPSLRARNAQPQNAPAAGVSISVKMIDAADSQTDPAGKQYRASVSKGVNVAAGVQIPQGTPATIVLVQGPGGWATQLTSLTVGGQAVAVTSTSASVTSAAQSAATAAANTVGSVFGGFGRRTPPAAVTAVATGQRVVLPPGVTLTFVVATPGGSGGAATTADAAPAAAPAVSATPETPEVPTGRPPVPAPATASPASSPATASARAPIPAPAGTTSAASSRPPIPAPGSAGVSAARAPIPAPGSPAAAPAANPVASSVAASGGLNAMEICFSNPPPTPSDPNHKTQYLTAAFEVPVDALKAVPVIEPAFSAYLKATYQYPSAGITCQPIWSITDAQQAQKKIASGRDTAKLNMVNTGWRYGQTPLVAGQNGFDPLSTGPGGLDLSQHRQTTYFCALTAAASDPLYSNHVTYVSSIFQADWDSAAVSMAYDAFIRDQYVHDLNMADLSPRCSAQSPAMQTMMHQSAMISNKRTGRSVPVDWTYTPAQGAAAHAEAAQAAASATTAANERYVYCLSGSTGTSVYFSEIFTAVPTSPTTGPHSGRNGFPEFSGPFLSFLQNKYGYKNDSNSPVMCRAIYNVNAAGLSAAQATKKAAEDLAKQANKQVVETGWKNQ